MTNYALSITQQHHPRDLEWDKRYDTPAVMQMNILPGVRITWNPDDNRFYVETDRNNEFHDWETVKTFAGNGKGWDNAKYCARRCT